MTTPVTEVTKWNDMITINVGDKLTYNGKTFEVTNIDREYHLPGMPYRIFTDKHQKKEFKYSFSNRVEGFFEGEVNADNPINITPKKRGWEKF